MTVPAHAVHPNVAALFGLHLSTKEGRSSPGKPSAWTCTLSRIEDAGDGRRESGARAAFREITNQWIADHPEVDPARTEMIKILSQAK